MPRQIENRNFLSPTGFKFTLVRAPKAAYFCNKANIPDLTLDTAIQPTYLKNIDQPGDKLQFGDLTLEFMVDEDLSNYMEIQNWLRGLGYPEKLDQIKELQQTGNMSMDLPTRSMENIFSDGTLQVLSSSMIPKFHVNFRQCFPYALTTMQFDATMTDIEYFTSEVSFKYLIYDITDISGKDLLVDKIYDPS